MLNGITVAVVNEHLLIAEAIAHVIGISSEFNIVAHCTTVEDAVSISRSLKPDVLVLDLTSSTARLGALQEIGRLGVSTKVAILAASEDQEVVFETLRHGASGYILKGITAISFREALRKVHFSGSYISPELGARLLSGLSRKSHGVAALKDSRLSEREAAIHRLIRKGYCNKEIGRSLDLTEKTVKYYITKMFRKLNVHNRTELALVQ